METNKLLGSLLLLTGVADILLARYLGTRIAEPVRTAIMVFGAGFIVVGSLLSLGMFKII